jgi:Uri superfamily endonuclease
MRRGGRCDECCWAEALDKIRGSRVPLAGFGASDCGCPSHLFFFASRPSLAAFDRTLGKPGLCRFRVEEG